MVYSGKVKVVDGENAAAEEKGEKEEKGKEAIMITIH